jgi:nitrite reductase (NO-forming)
MNLSKFFLSSLIIAILLAGCAGPVDAPGKVSEVSVSRSLIYHLKSDTGAGGMWFMGVDGDIAGQTNPTLQAKVGDTLSLTLTSGDGALHDFVAPDYKAKSIPVSGEGKSITLTFKVDKAGTFPYYCSIPGHREAGMEGKIVVTGDEGSAKEALPAPGDGNVAAVKMAMTPTALPAAANLVDIVRAPTDLPAPVGAREPKAIRVDLETVEVNGLLADGTTFTYWTFNGQVPGPFLRVRVGDTVEVHLKNDPGSMMPHSVDFHAVTGPGGGAVFTNTAPGKETQFTFQALNPGLFVYHCATPMVAQHIANGMYGLILVEPEGGLSKVDHEFYVMQGEIYTSGAYGQKGHQPDDVQKLLDETPEYFVFNGAVGALTAQKPLKAAVGETVRIFFGVGGPNFIASFHVIGEIFDRVYDQASLTAPPLTNVQTTLVPPGGATVVEFKLQVPGRYIMVDHALSRLQRGLAGYLLVEGPAAPDIFNGTPMPGSGH